MEIKETGNYSRSLVSDEVVLEYRLNHEMK
jgi:hypothetical protein